LGKVGVGKSTFFNLMKNPTTDAIKQSLTSQTKNPIFQPFALKHNNEDIIINLIDTPGLREINTGNDKSDVQITESIIELAKEQITKNSFVNYLCIYRSKIYRR